MTVREAVAAFVLVVAVPAGAILWNVQVDNRLERWQGSDTASARTYEQFKQTFGSDEFVLLALWDGPLFDPDALAVMVDVADAIESIPGVTRVAGLPVFYRDLFDSEEPEAFAEEMTSTPFYEGLFLSKDTRTAAVIVTVTPPDDPGGRRTIMRRLKEAALPLSDAGFTTGFVGPTALIDALDQLSESESRRSFAAALVASLLALAFFSRSMRAMSVTAVCALITIVLTMALVVVTGHTLNMITSVLPALLWVLALSGAIHLVGRYRHHRGAHPQAGAIALALEDTTRPMTLAALTTAAGFASLAVARMDPVRELGAFAAAGILLSLATNLTVGPLLIRLFKVPEARRSADLEFHGRWLQVGLTHPRMVIVGTLLLMAACICSLPMIKVASNPLGFLPEDHPTIRDYRRVGDSIAGFNTLEIVLELPTSWTDPDNWPAIDRLTEQLNSAPIVTRALSPLDLLRKLEHWRNGMDPSAYRLPASQAEALDLLSELDRAASERLAAMVSDDGTTVRLSAMVNEMDEDRFLGLVADARDAVAHLPNGITGIVTGQVLLLVEAQQSLVSTQIRSLVLALFVVFAVIGVGLRFRRLTIVSALPNAIPLLVAFAVMAIARIPLDAATVMVASIALGIAVDDTVHLLVAIDCSRSADQPGDHLRRALEHVAPALVLTTVAACIGFFSLTWSAFVPIDYFGLLAGIAMLTALFADLWLVPALLSVRRVMKKE